MSELDKIKQKTGFKIPDNYFDDFSEKMMQNINKEKPVKGSSRFIRALLSAAAVIVGFGVISYYVYNNSPKEHNQTEINTIALNGFEEDYYYSEELIIDVMADDEIESDALSEEFLMDYLDDEFAYHDLLAEL